MTDRLFSNTCSRLLIACPKKSPSNSTQLTQPTPSHQLQELAAYEKTSSASGSSGRSGAFFPTPGIPHTFLRHENRVARQFRAAPLKRAEIGVSNGPESGHNFELISLRKMTALCCGPNAMPTFGLLPRLGYYHFRLFHDVWNTLHI